MDERVSVLRRTAPAAILALATLLVGFVVGLGARGGEAKPPAGSSPILTVAAARGPSSADAVSDGSLTSVARSVMAAVANISSTRTVRTREAMSPFLNDPFFRHFFGGSPEVPRERREQSLGSGVIVTQDGYVLTNNHVVEDADEILVTLADRHEFQAKVVGTDPKTDLAVLKLDAKDLPYLPLGDSDSTEVGEVVLAVGNPFGLNQTVTMGIISAKGRANVGIADYEDFIQTDAAINPGNSGGALVNGRGELIGINTAIASRTGGYQGIGFAIPSNMARDVSEALIRHGKVTRGWLGVGIQEVTPPLAEAFGLESAEGALVGDVNPDSPAGRGGLKRGDVIVEFGSEKIHDSLQLRLLVARTPVGEKVGMVVLRGGKRVHLEVTIDENPDDKAGAPPQGGEVSDALSGVRVEDLTPAIIRSLGIPADVQGVVVSNVEPGSAAQEAGLARGDVIRELNRNEVASVREFAAAAHRAKNKPVVLLIQRGENTFYMTIRG